MRTSAPQKSCGCCPRCGCHPSASAPQTATVPGSFRRWLPQLPVHSPARIPGSPARPHSAGRSPSRGRRAVSGFPALSKAPCRHPATDIRPGDSAYSAPAGCLPPLPRQCFCPATQSPLPDRYTGCCLTRTARSSDRTGQNQSPSPPVPDSFPHRDAVSVLPTDSTTPRCRTPCPLSYTAFRPHPPAAFRLRE